ncbi:MAG: hypothetical protein Q9225_006306, partial [Loekoesia sp. 1 TL-2023]
MIFLVFRVVLLFAIFSLSLSFPTASSDDSITKIQHDDSLKFRQLQDSSNAYVTQNSRLIARSTVSELLSKYPSIAASDLLITLPPDPSKHRFIFTSYNAFHPVGGYWLTSANNASAALSSFYAAVASQSSSFGQQNLQTESAMAFGAG